MLGAGLRREFPGASAWIAGVTGRIRPRVRRSDLLFAVLAGLGASALVSAIFSALGGIAFSIFELPREWRDPFSVRIAAVTLGATAIGAAVSLRSGGWRALLGLGGVLAAFAVIDTALAAPGLALFCERSGGGAGIPLCSRTIVDELASRWSTIVGLAAGLLAARLLIGGTHGSNAGLEAIGIVAAL